MEVKNPRRVLAVSLADSTQHLSKIIKDLTGAHPEPASTSLAGTTHVLPLKTSYYTADVPVWLDLIGSPAEWSASFLSDEAKEVLSVLGGLAVVFALPAAATSSSPSPAVGGPETTTPSAQQTRALITEVGKVVREGLGGWSWDGVSLGVGVGEGETEEWEDLCAEWGLEFVQVRGGKKDDGRNEFGEKMGISRVLEALEANDWTGDGAADLDSDAEEGNMPRKPRPLAAGSDDEDEFDLDDPESLDFGFDKADFEGLKQAIWNLEQEREEESTKGKEGDGEGSADKQGETEKKVNNEKEKKATDESGDLNGEEVEKLERMMRKLQAVRDTSAGLPLDQRRKMAKKAVGEVMKDL
ncbi:alpha and gamma adaptin binding protein p34 [Colletotrichum musicola]|uniref:Alpha and gamma adaptin binding protein p34 n=1 Tax=Colletotrichum musicola TaxID=2175873 RepID=A0A8H6NYT7_9PEZI|nr:alpha and gamma adaptin binding protein p34 [Colletotrichum musicola]